MNNSVVGETMEDVKKKRIGLRLAVGGKTTRNLETRLNVVKKLTGYT